MSQRWLLVSSAGRASIEFEAVQGFTDAWLLDVLILQRCWRPSLGGMDVADEHRFELSQIRVSRRRLAQFSDSVGQWLKTRDLFSVALSDSTDGGPNLTLSLDQSERLISSTEKPVFDFAYDNGSTSRFHWQMPVDESVLGRFFETMPRF